MESSEDDAGNATSASRRVSAREKDIEQTESVDATSCYHQEQYETRILCGTPAISEDNFDGDSVPSPSAQDVNTSTEAILDMIDEIVDGPGAPKRIPLSLRTYDTDSSGTSVAVHDGSDPKQDSRKLDNIDIPMPSKVALVGETKIDNQYSATQAQVQFNLSSCTMSTEAMVTESVALSIPCVIESQSNEPVSALAESNSLVSCMESEPSTSCSLSHIPSSNIIQDVQNSLVVSDSEKTERTIKCVSSSDNRDSVIVESAESTSSDCTLSESKTIGVELTTRSPLKRRLVRPAPSDRRPDSTVSSTADSQNIDLNTSKPISSENIVKDVSSSSDAVPPLQDSVKLEEIRDISEISICKAETSVSPPKKIKLIRPKVLPSVYNKNDVIVDKQIPSNQCESTVSDIMSTSSVEHMPNICVSSPKSVIDTKTQSSRVLLEKDLCTKNISTNITESTVSDILINKNVKDMEIECAGPSLPVPTLPLLPNPDKDLTSFKETSEVVDSIKNTELKENCIEISPKAVIENVESVITSSIESSKICMEGLKIPEVSNTSNLRNKMNFNMVPIHDPSQTSSECETNKNVPSAEINNSQPQLLDTALNSKSKKQIKHSDSSQVLHMPTSSDIESELNPASEMSINTSDCYKDLEKKVPPIKLNLSQLSGMPQETTSKYVDQPPNIINKSDIPELSNSESKLKTILRPSNTDCLQETEKKVPPIKLNLSELSDSPPQNRLDDEHQEHPSNIFNVSGIMEPSTESITSISETNNSTSVECFQISEKKVPPIKLTFSQLSDTSTENINVISELPSSTKKENLTEDEHESIKQVPKLTIKLINKPSEEIKSPIPKLTIKPIKPPSDKESSDKVESNQQIPSITKINIKAIPKPPEKNYTLTPMNEMGEVNMESETIPTVTKLNIKPILRPPEKINDIHRKSSSSEISESECSENDESTSTSDQASASDNCTSEVVPKVTIKLGKPGTQSEGKFYTEQNVPKLTIKGLPNPEKVEQESVSKLKVVMSQSEDKQVEKVPKLTIKTVSKSETQPLSPKLIIKHLKTPDSSGKEAEIPKLKIIAETLSLIADPKENVHVPKITIKPITKPDTDTPSKSSKKSGSVDSPEHIPVVTKLNIKPVLKPTEISESLEDTEDNVVVVSKLSIKPTKLKDNEVDSSIEDVPKVTKLNIKPLRNPEVNASEHKDCDDMNADIDINSIPIVTKINIKPIIKPLDKEITKDSENQSPETGNSSDENSDIPVVTKLNIKPILKPLVSEEASKLITCNESNIPVVTKLNIKPLVKPDESTSPCSPKKDSLKSPGSHSPTIPVITKLNIKPLVKPDEIERLKEEHGDKLTKNPPLVMKINMKTVTDSIINEICSTSTYSCNNFKDNVDVKLNTEVGTEGNTEIGIPRISSDKVETLSAGDCMQLRSAKHAGVQENVTLHHTNIQNCITNIDPIDTFISKTLDNVTNPIGSPKLEDSETGIIGAMNTEQSSATSLINKASQRDVIKSSEIQGSEILRKNSRATLQYCTLLKKLLENPKEDLGRKSNEFKELTKVDGIATEKLKLSSAPLIDNVNCELNITMKSDKRDLLDNIINSEKLIEEIKRKSPNPDKINDINTSSESNVQSLQNFSKTVNESITKPLEICVTEKNTNQTSGQDSPRIILKINKTDHGPSAKIITEDLKKFEINQNDTNPQLVNDRLSPKKHLENSRKKGNTELGFQNILAISTRLRSSRKLENVEISPPGKQSAGKRPSSTEPSPSHNRENEMSVLDAKRLKLGQILSNSAMISQSVTITPVVAAKATQPSPIKPSLEIRRGGKLINHSILNNDNCSKNGNSKLHNILTNLHTKQMHALPFNELNCSEKTQSTSSEMDSNASTGSSEVTENILSETQPIQVQEMLINENSDFRDLSVVSEELSQDPLEPENQSVEEPSNGKKTPLPVETTPQPKKRGRPRKLPVTESSKPTVVTLPVPALEERPQRSLRLTR